MKLSLCAVLFASFGFGCGTSDNSPALIAGFDPAPVADGFTRYVTPVVTDIKPGDDLEYCQWVAATADSDQDVMAFGGSQSETGHHAVLFATTETNFKVGESHICTTADMLSVSYIGAIFGVTGGTPPRLPDGLYFRLRKGQALMVNTHWLNATDQTVSGQAVVDVKFAAADQSHQIADIFANNGDTFTIPAGQLQEYDVSCTFPQDMNLAMAANHMHTAGMSVYTEVQHTDGTSTMLRDDTSWTSDEQFNPVYTMFSLAQPFVIKSGETIHTHCVWDNQTAKDLSFPDEMCAGTGFYFPGNGLSACDDGAWDSGTTAD